MALWPYILRQSGVYGRRCSKKLREPALSPLGETGKGLFANVVKCVCSRQGCNFVFDKMVELYLNGVVAKFAALPQTSGIFTLFSLL